jgi:hypothetical protein
VDSMVTMPGDKLEDAILERKVISEWKFLEMRREKAEIEEGKTRRSLRLCRIRRWRPRCLAMESENRSKDLVNQDDFIINNRKGQAVCRETRTEWTASTPSEDALPTEGCYVNHKEKEKHCGRETH